VEEVVGRAVLLKNYNHMGDLRRERLFLGFGLGDEGCRQNQQE
jgi:hypothetical protein